MRGRWSRWVSWIDRREDNASLALMRVAIGLTLLWTLGDIALSGVVELVYLPPEHGGFREMSERHWLIRALGGASPGAVWGLILSGIGLSAALIAGVGRWLAPLLLLQALLALFSLHGASGGGHDRVLYNALFILIVAGGASRETPTWARYLAVFQLVLIYFTTGVQKIGGEWMPWGDLSALYHALQLPAYRRVALPWLAEQPWFLFTQIGTAVTMLFEWTSPLLALSVYWAETAARPGRLRALANRLRLREIYVIVGITLHLGISLTMQVGPFTPAMLSLYACLYPPETWRRLAQRVRSTASAKRASA